MVYLHSSISVCNSVDPSSSVMANSINSNELYPKSRNRKATNNNQYNHQNNHANCTSIPVCDRSRFAVIDVLILIAVIIACGFLLYPYFKFITTNFIEFVGLIHYVVKEEIVRNPIVYASIGISTFCAAITAWIVLICTTRKCGNPSCKGLRKAAEFDIQLETEECVKSSNGNSVKDGVKRGLFELPRDHHRELEAELKKMAPPNGRAVLVFRARCGCSVGRLEVPGRKKLKKIKK
ncbi:Ribosomal protein L34e superfamily protein [Euphorbia peplus]|nr:Ribosomal protein L34e superfamily protein [Euphorbia peplus]